MTVVGTTDPGAIASSFTSARAAGRALDTYPGTPPATLDSAYAVQAAAIQQWREPIAGWKVARVPPGFTTQFPEERLIGPAFARNVHYVQSGEVAQCPVFEGGFAAVEAEIVIVIAADAPEGKQVWTADSVLDFVRSMHVGVEVASSPLATLNDLGPGAVISDFGNNWGVVVGPEINNWRELDSIDVETFIDGMSVGRGKAIKKSGPLGALAFTLNKRAAQGATLRAGDVVSTGMITGVHDVRIGQQSRHVFSGCGEVNVRITRATPIERG
ncbi:MAG TPA: fumarylacetoacetate hydrolase family protein [Steroidobacteraceae bacterium]|nr:fumarylacetoacetate hydrolase family protein [Steroidobacteraceae bacterium]